MVSRLPWIGGTAMMWDVLALVLGLLAGIGSFYLGEFRAETGWRKFRCVILRRVFLRRIVHRFKRRFA
jgi:hypothetical protein